MGEVGTRRGFAAFREAVCDDMRLLQALRPPQDRDAYIAHVVATGARHGFAFDVVEVGAALREGQDRWLMTGADVV